MMVRPLRLLSWSGLAGFAWVSSACADLIGADFDEKKTDPRAFNEGAGADTSSLGGSSAGGEGISTADGGSSTGGTGGRAGADGGTSSGGGSGGGTSSGGTSSGGASSGGADNSGGAGGNGNEPSCDAFEEGLVLNEIRGQGGTDYIELYNASTATMNLTGYKVSDGGNVSTLPSGTMLSAGDTLYLQTVGTGLECPNPEGCFEFGVSASGETVYLYDSDGKLLDSIGYPNENGPTGLINGETWGRLPDGCTTITYLAPTPDQPNEPSTFR